LAFFDDMTTRMWLLYLGAFLGVLGGALLGGYVGVMAWSSIRWAAGRFGKPLLSLLLWCASLGLGYSHIQYCWQFDQRVTVDFSNQWLMGRMFTENQGHNLYLAKPQNEVLGTGYQDPHDRYQMYHDIVLKGMHNTGEGGQPRNEIEGPLYPPTMSLFMATIAWRDPLDASRELVLFYVVLTFAAGGLVYWGTGGRIWGSAATLLFLGFPNYYHGLYLVQNSYFTLFLVVAGWALWARGYQWSGGFVWSCLAYKAVFAVALLLAPILLLRWRVFAGMVLGGTMWCIATLPFCLPPEDRHLFAKDPATGRWELDFDRERFDRMLDPWFRWLEVGKHASLCYDRDYNWIWMSRDLYALPRRACWEPDVFKAQWRSAFYLQERFQWLDPKDNRWKVVVRLDSGENVDTQAIFSRPDPSRREETHEDVGTYFGWKICPTILSRALLFGMIGVTVLTFAVFWFVRWWRGLTLTLSPHGPCTAFAILAGLLSCFHFIHYDLLPMALPVALLWAGLGSAGGGRWRIAVWFWQSLLSAAMIVCGIELAFGPNSVTRLPFETFVALLLWMWCGVRMLVEESGSRI
jgi:hypothetical protein